MAYIEQLKEDLIVKNKLKNAFYRSSGSIFSDVNLLTLQQFSHPLKRDSKNTANIYFKNGICEISKDKIVFVSYENITGYIWDSQIIDHEFQLASYDEVKSSSEFYSFLHDICTSIISDAPELTEQEVLLGYSENLSTKEEFSQAKLDSLLSIIGYLIHDYKDPATAKAVILMDEEESEEPNGGKGKGILKRAISLLKKMANEDGKNFSNKSEFAFSQIDYDTKIIVLDDVPSNFPFEKYFSIITEGMVVNKKYQHKHFMPFENSPKVMLTTNYVVWGEGESYERRKIEFAFSNFYGINNTPEQKFKHLLFNDWDDKQWNLFYNLMIICMQQYLLKGLIKPPPLNLAYKRLKTGAGERFISFVGRNARDGVKWDKEDLCQAYKAVTNHKMSQRKFTIFLRLYAKAFNLKMVETKSGSDYYFTFYKN